MDSTETRVDHGRPVGGSSTDLKTLVGVLVSHDDVAKNEELRKTIEYTIRKHPSFFEHYHFVFTEGTFRRIVLGDEAPLGGTNKVVKLDLTDSEKELLHANSTVLPRYDNGGVTLLAFLIAQRTVSILWSFLTPLTSHWLNPEDQALLRLSDVWRVKRLMSKGSVVEWLNNELDHDRDRNQQPLPLAFSIRGLENKHIVRSHRDPEMKFHIFDLHSRAKELQPEGLRTIALIAHNEMKPRMAEFAIDHESELRKFDRILTTGTTGRLISDSTNYLDSTIHRCHSGPYGGDIEIAVEIMLGLCKYVVFFVDPLNPHPHMNDIRTVFGACMRRDDIGMMANETHAREWIERVVRKW